MNLETIAQKYDYQVLGIFARISKTGVCTEAQTRGITYYNKASQAVWALVSHTDVTRPGFVMKTAEELAPVKYMPVFVEAE